MRVCTATLEEAREVAEEAVRRCLPVISGLITDGLTEGRTGFHVVVIQRSTANVLYEHSVGNPDQWKKPFDRHAKSKAKISKSHDEPSVDVPLAEREVGDTQYWGSAVAQDDVVVAISGLQPELDELGSWQIEAAYVGLMKLRGHIARGPEPDRSKPDFITEEWLAELVEAHETDPAAQHISDSEIPVRDQPAHVPSGRPDPD